MRTIRDSDTARLAKTAATGIISDIEKIYEEKKSVLLGLVGGRSVDLAYKELSLIDSLAWKETHFILLDERLVPIDSEESNYNLVKKTLLNPLLERGQINEKNIHPFNTASPESGIEEYSKLVESMGNVDVAVLSSGEDNHVAAIFPEKKYPDDLFALLHDSPKPPKDRMTSTPELISKSSSCFIFFMGNEKKDALKNFLNNEDILPVVAVKNISSITLITDLNVKE